MAAHTGFLPIPPPEARTRRLHLVAGLESAWIPKPREEAGFRQLEALLARHPAICLTLVARAEFETARDLIRHRLELSPQHLVSSGGRIIHHLREDGSWESDAAFTEWLDRQSIPRHMEEKPLAILPVAIEYLEIQWAAPRPLVVFASPISERDLLILADIPIPTGGAPAELAPFASRLPPAQEAKAGRRGLLELLGGMAFQGIPPGRRAP